MGQANAKKGLFIKRGHIFCIAFLVIFVLFLGKLSYFGFALSDYLGKYPMVSYIAAWIFIVSGFLACYHYFKSYASWTLNLAIRVYLLAALGMSGVYYMVFSSHIGCFSLPDDILTSPSIVDFIYFSFVTVTTVGYGDIVPQHTFVRALVLFQVLFGLYLVLKITKTHIGKKF